MKVLKETIDTIKKPEFNFWYPLIVMFLGVGITWGATTTKISSLEERFNYFGGRFQDRVDLVDEKLNKQDDVFLDIQVKLAEIQKDILFIKESLNDHRTSE